MRRRGTSRSRAHAAALAFAAVSAAGACSPGGDEPPTLSVADFPIGGEPGLPAEVRSAVVVDGRRLVIDVARSDVGADCAGRATALGRGDGARPVADDLRPVLVTADAKPFLLGTRRVNRFDTTPLVWRSVDGGRTFTAPTFEGPLPPGQPLDLRSVGNALVLLTSALEGDRWRPSSPRTYRAGLWRSADGGARWVPIAATGLPAGDEYLPTSLARLGDELVVADGPGRRFASSDGGRSWRRWQLRRAGRARGSGPARILPTTNGSSSSRLLSADGGRTWAEPGPIAAPPGDRGSEPSVSIDAVGFSPGQVHLVTIG